jgi:hypothetical protein
MWSLTASSPSSSIVLVSFVIISTTILMLNSLVRFAFSINPIDQSFDFFPSYAIYVRSSLFNAHKNTFTPLGWLSYLAASVQPIMICLDYFAILIYYLTPLTLLHVCHEFFQLYALVAMLNNSFTNANQKGIEVILYFFVISN